MSIVVYCSGSVSKGLGHIQRARVFSDSLFKAGYNVTMFIRADKELILSHQYVGYQMNRINDDEELVTFIINQKPSLLVFDTLSFPEALFERIEPHIAVISISPIFNLNNRMKGVFSRVLLEGVSTDRLFYGLQYSIFSEYCKSVDYYHYLEHLSQETLSIGVSMGGTDAPNKTLRIVEALSKINNPSTFWILLGEGYLHSYDELAHIAGREKKHEFILAKTSRSMWKILSSCSLNILSGGITLLESVYAGIPSIHLFEKEEHRKLVPEEIRDKGSIVDLGVFKEDTLVELPNVIENMIENRSILLRMHESMKGILDKQAPVRIIRICEQKRWLQ